MSVLLDVEALMVEYPARRLAGCPSTVLNGVSVSVRAGECLGIVGAQGSGKTTFSNAVLGLVPVTSGSIRFRGEDIVGASHGRRRRLNEKIQAVFHDPYSSLHPSRTVEASLIEPLRAGHVPARAAARRVRELLRQVGLPVTASHRLPGELSDADRQRIALARALTLSPELIIFDDPVSALDAPARSALLELLMDLQETTGTAYLFISPDLAAVRLISHRTAVLERGEIAERGAGNRGLGDPELAYARRARVTATAPALAPDQTARGQQHPAGGQASQRATGMDQLPGPDTCRATQAGGTEGQLPATRRRSGGSAPSPLTGGRPDRSARPRGRTAQGRRPSDRHRGPGR